VPGKSVKGVLVEYGPGVASVGHTHPRSAFIYATVLEGAIRTSVNDGPAVTYRAGQNFPEMPGDRHTLDENASKTEPAKLLAVFVVDTDEKELLTPLEKCGSSWVNTKQPSCGSVLGLRRFEVDHRRNASHFAWLY
jgi:quercetin dioxygenase-like cupin family protein